MHRVLIVLVTAILMAVCATTASAEVISIDGTVKSVDVKKRTITVTTATKEMTLDVGSKAKISVDGSDSSLDSLKDGQTVSLSYHDQLEVVVKIESKASPTAKGQDWTILNLEELNGPGNDAAPWISTDGLDIFWTTALPGENLSIWSARRKNPDGFFEGKKRLFSGNAPVLSSDCLEMYFRNADAETISLATRKTRDEEFERPRPVPSLTFPGLDAAPRWLTQDRLTLYLDLKDAKGGVYCWEVKRETLNSNWTKPNKTVAKFEGMPSKFRFIQVCATPDNRNLFCTSHDSKDYRAGILSRKEPTGPFTHWTELPITGLNGQIPCFKLQFVAATHELFLSSNRIYSDPQGHLKRKFDLGVIKNFQPPVPVTTSF